MGKRIAHGAILQSIVTASVIALILFSGCGDEPSQANSLTSSLPTIGFKVYTTTIEAASGSTFQQIIPMDGIINLVGSNNGFTAVFPLQFYPSLFPVRDTINVLSAQLTLHGISLYGDPASLFSMTAFKIVRSWQQTTLTWDSVQTGFYDPAAIVGHYAGSPATDTGAVTFALDTALVRGWLSSATVGTNARDGIILIADQSVNMLRGFSSCENDTGASRPTLRIIAENVAGTVRDTAIYNLGIDTFCGSLSPAPSDSTLMVLQAGVAYRGKLTFDVSSIPRGAIVNKADLEVVRDPGASWIGPFTTDSVVTCHYLNSSTDNTRFNITTPIAEGRRKADASYTFRFDVRTAVQAWLSGTNYGLLFRVKAETSTADRYAFHNYNAADPSLRPRIRITYSVQER